MSPKNKSGRLESATVTTKAQLSPLEIEEVLYEIVSYLDRETLTSCIMVSKIWYRASIRVLWTCVKWKNAPNNDFFRTEFERYGRYAIELQDCHHADLMLIAATCSRLRELRLAWTLSTDNGLDSVFINSPKIYHLCLFNCRQLTPKALISISQLCNLRRLELQNLIQITEESLTAILASCSQLQYLSLTDTRLAGITLDSLGSRPLCLRTLILARSSPLGRMVKNILRNAPYIDNLSLARNIHSVFQEEDLALTTTVSRNISVLNLESCKSFQSSALLLLFRTCPRLVSVNVSGVNIDDRSLDVLALSCPHLRTLNLAWCVQLSDEGLLRLLGSCSDLTFLDITTAGHFSAAIFREDVPWACTRLETLVILGVNMAESQNRSVTANHSMMFNQLSRLGMLLDLALGGPTFVLELEAGLAKLGSLTQLQSIRVTQLQVVLAEEEIRWLAEAWPRLKRARFLDASLPLPWIRYFRQLRPHLSIHIGL